MEEKSKNIDQLNISLKEKFLINVIKVIFLLIITYLTLWSAFYTCSVNRYENTSYQRDSIITNTGCFILVMCCCIGIAYLKKKDNKRLQAVLDKLLPKITIFMILIWSIFTVTWIMSTQLKPIADQHYILNTARNIENKDYSDFEKNAQIVDNRFYFQEGGYMDMSVNQNGIVLFLVVLGKVIGQYNYLAIQLINFIAMLISYYYIYKISMKIFNERNKNIAYLVLISLFMYIQMAFYTTFVYGNIIGLMFSLIAVYFELKYFEKNKFIYIIISFISITLAIIIKQNYLITLVAMEIILIYELIFKRRYESIILSLLLIFFWLIGIKIVDITIENITGKEINGGIPSIAYIEMGLQSDGYAPGWYNAYNRIVYIKNDLDTEKTKIAVKEDLKNTLNHYWNHPYDFLDHINQKILSQWINPTFQSLWIAQNRESNIEISQWSKDIINEQGMYNYFATYMDIMQTMILLGTLIYIFVDFEKIEFKNLIFAIIFIGGFLFHIIWEAKCQYTITYFILIIPYSVKGYVVAIEEFKKLLEKA